jgi:Orsellinic acid/F9775 biosynthesis cluster protein D
MDDEATTFNNLVKDLVIYHPNLGLAICQPCQVALPNDIERHFSRLHKNLKLAERHALVQYIQSLPRRRSIEQLTSDLSATMEIEEIRGLHTIDGWKCNQCLFLGADSTVEKHCRDHGWITGQRTYKVISS